MVALLEEWQKQEAQNAAKASNHADPPTLTPEHYRFCPTRSTLL
jgi:hypothetical protein